MYRQLVAEHLEDILNRFVDVHFLTHHLGLAGKIPHVLDHPGGALHVAADILCQGFDFLTAER